GNVICFGLNKIDSPCRPENRRTISLTFELDKILNNFQFPTNPNIFFKQCDFGSRMSLLSQEIDLGNEKIIFTLLGETKKKNFTALKMYNNSNELMYYSELPQYSLISYNVQDMQKILVLNFFRFLDTLKFASHSREKDTDAIEEINRIYKLISDLSDS